MKTNRKYQKIDQKINRNRLILRPLETALFLIEIGSQKLGIKKPLKILATTSLK